MNKTTKTKTLRARRMWANYYPAPYNPSLHMTKALAILSRGQQAERTLPVAVIPLDDIPALVQKAKGAFSKEGTSLFTPAMYAALTAIGVLPAKRGKKVGAK
jgi:hypothetical protein